MDNDIKTWLYDILQSINEIDSYFDNQPKVFEEYVSDIKTRRAIEREEAGAWMEYGKSLLKVNVQII